MTAPKPGKGARVMHMLFNRQIEGIANYASKTKEYTDQVPVAVLPCATAAQARMVVRFANMPAEKRELLLSQAVTDAIFGEGIIPAIETTEQFKSVAAAFCDALGLIPPAK